MFVPNHLHLLVKGYIKTPPQTENVLNEWFTQLVNNVGMKVVAGPTSVYVNEPGNEGITGTVTLATSHDSIHVWCGAVGSIKTFGTKPVSVPSTCWKVIYIKKTKEYRAYIFPNTSDKPKLESLKVRKEDVEKLSGFKFF